jgi:hypothetical protein
MTRCLSLCAMAAGVFASAPAQAVPIYQTVQVSPPPSSPALEVPVLIGDPAADFDAFLAAGFQHRLSHAGLGELLDMGKVGTDPVSEALWYDRAIRKWLASRCYEDVGAVQDSRASKSKKSPTISELDALSRQIDKCLGAMNRLLACHARLRDSVQWDPGDQASAGRRWALTRAQAEGFGWVPPNHPGEMDEAQMRETLDSLAQALRPVQRVVDEEDLWRGQGELSKEDHARIREEMGRLHTQGRDGRSEATWIFEMDGQELEFRYDRQYAAWRARFFDDHELGYRNGVEQLESIRQSWACRLGDFAEIQHKQGKKSWETILVWPGKGAHLGLDLGYRPGSVLTFTTATLTIIPTDRDSGQEFALDQLKLHHPFETLPTSKVHSESLVCE